jgi:putative acetyltransferase
VHDQFVTRIRPEQRADIDGTRAVNLAAFETSSEADLVDVLRERADPVVSLVADAGDAIVGHILFSPATLPGYPDLRIMGLAPMAVAPARQRQGIGAALIREGLEQCRRLGVGAVIVLGHADYYPRFGFRAASAFGLRSEYEVPDDVFMALELVQGSLHGASGTMQYHPAFADP